MELYGRLFRFLNYTFDFFSFFSLSLFFITVPQLVVYINPHTYISKPKGVHRITILIFYLSPSAFIRKLNSDCLSVKYGYPSLPAYVQSCPHAIRGEKILDISFRSVENLQTNSRLLSSEFLILM